MPCEQFAANAVFFRIGVIAYNLFIGFKRSACPPEWGSYIIGTFRWRWIQVAGRIVRHAGQVILKMRVSAKTLCQVEEIRRRCFDFAFVT